jgi:hypothetical protein
MLKSSFPISLNWRQSKEGYTKNVKIVIDHSFKYFPTLSRKGAEV